MRKLSLFLSICLFFTHSSVFAVYEKVGVPLNSFAADQNEGESGNENTPLMSSRVEPQAELIPSEILSKAQFAKSFETPRDYTREVRLAGLGGLFLFGGLSTGSCIACWTYGTATLPEASQLLWGAGNLAGCALTAGSGVLWQQCKEPADSKAVFPDHSDLVRDAYLSLSSNQEHPADVRKAKKRLARRLAVLNNEGVLDPTHFAYWLVLSDQLGKFVSQETFLSRKVKEMQLDIKEDDIRACSFLMSPAHHPILAEVGRFMWLEPLALLRTALKEVPQNDSDSSFAIRRIQELRIKLETLNQNLPEVFRKHLQEIQAFKKGRAFEEQKPLDERAKSEETQKLLLEQVVDEQ